MTLRSEDYEYMNPLWKMYHLQLFSDCNILFNIMNSVAVWRNHRIHERLLFFSLSQQLAY